MFSNLGGGGMFGQPQQQQQQPTGMFGGPQQATGGGLFGGPQPGATGGLFGGGGGMAQQQPPPSMSMGGIGGLLGNQPTAQPVFGQQAQPQGGLFGGPATNTGGSFGQPNFGQPQQPQSAGLFGTMQTQQPMQPQPMQQTTGFSGMFGQTQQPQPQQQTFGPGGGLFGQQPTTQQYGQPASTGLFGTQQPQTGGGLFQPQSLQKGQSVPPTWGATTPQYGGGVTAFPGGGQTGQVQQSVDDSTNDFNLDQSCSRLEDAIQAIQWNYMQPRVLAAATWEGKVRVYELVQSMQNMSQQVLQERKVFQVEVQPGMPNPILCLDWKSDSTIIFVGTGLDNTVRAIQVQSGQNIPIGQHGAPVIAVYWIEQLQQVLSISCDQTMKMWNLNTPGQPTYQMQFQHKPLVADLNFPMLMIGFAQEKLLLLDLNQLQMIRNLNYTNSPLGDFSRLTCLSLFPNRDGFGIGSVDGRGHMSQIVVKYGQPNSYEYKNIMTFKAHKVEEQQQGGGRSQSFFFPVNALQFNGRNNFFMMTAGGEGQMIFWDYKEKNKIKTFQFNNTPITAAKVSHDKQFLAYALGNDFSKGADGYSMGYATKLCVHYIPDNELKCSQR